MDFVSTEPKLRQSKIQVDFKGSYGIQQIYSNAGSTINALLNTSIGSIAVYDLEEKQVVFSQWLILQSFGYEPREFQELSGNVFWGIAHPDDRENITRHLSKVEQSKSGEVLNLNLRVKDKNGFYRWIHLRDTVISRDENGKATKVLATVVDTTKYRLLKKQIDGQLINLDHLSYKNSHQLRSPVASILGLVALLKSEHRTESCEKEILDLLERTILKMDSAIREFEEELSENKKQLKKFNMEIERVAENKFYSLSVNHNKNRAYLKIKGFWKNKEVVPNYLTDWKKVTSLLKRNFTLLTDASEMKTHPQDVRKLHEDAQIIIINSGVKRIAEIVKDDIAEIQLNAMAKKTELPKRNFRNAADAEQWLDD